MARERPEAELQESRFFKEDGVVSASSPSDIQQLLAVTGVEEYLGI